MFGQPAGRSQLGWLRRRHRPSVVDRFRQQPGGCLTRLPPPRRGSLIPEFTGTTGKPPFCSHQRTACAPPSSLVSGEYIFTLAANAASTKKRIVLNGIAVLVVSVLVYEWWTGSPPSAPVRHVTAGGSYDTLTSAQRRLVDDWAYVTHYMQSRTPLALQKDSTISRLVMAAAVGRIVVTPHVGRLHHRYDRAAA